jgi:CRP/FNR family transcriptional regulator, cyclic AMP receptor protein
MITPSEQITDLFYFLAEDDLVQLMHYFSFRHVEAGELLWIEGAVCNYMAFIVSGKLEVSKETEFKGKQVVVGVISDGAMVGDACMIDRRPRGESVKAMTDSALLCISLEHFEELLEKEAELGRKLLKSMLLSMSTRLRHNIGRLAAIF